MLKRVFIAVAIAAAGAANANAATIQMQVTPQVTKSSPAYPVKGGGYAFGAPYTAFKFDVQVLNDANVEPGYVSGVGYAKVQIIARTGDGETVAAESDYFGAPISRTVWLKENTIFYARVLASPAHGIAAQTDAANPFTARAYLRHYPSAFHSSFNRTLTFSGFFSRVDGIAASNAVRVLIQRKTNKGYVTVATLRPNAKREYKRVIRYGTIPKQYRVRVIAVGTPKRYVTVDEYKHCVASTRAKAAQACKAVSLGVR